MKIDFVGKAVEIDSGKTYVIEIDHQVSFEQASVIEKMWKDETHSKCVILSGGARVVRTTQQEVQDRIAWEIEAQYCVENKPDDCYGVNGEHCQVLKKAATIARGERYE